jgi:hypothetical protein
MIIILQKPIQHAPKICPKEIKISIVSKTKDIREDYNKKKTSLKVVNKMQTSIKIYKK